MSVNRNDNDSLVLPSASALRPNLFLLASLFCEFFSFTVWCSVLQWCNVMQCVAHNTEERKLCTSRMAGKRWVWQLQCALERCQHRCTASTPDFVTLKTKLKGGGKTLQCVNENYKEVRFE